MQISTITWIPVDAGYAEDGSGYWMDGCPFHTFGLASHTGDDDLVYADGITGPEFKNDARRKKYEREKAEWDALSADEKRARYEAGKGPDFLGRNPWGLDPEIADLVIALNRAGIKTLQSCQDIAGFLQEEDEDVPRMGIVLVAWDSFPKVQATLPESARGDGHGDGWLFAADPSCRFVSVIFPWRDHDEWLKAI